MSVETVRVVLFPEGNTWIAQALEYDIAAQGPKMKEAFRRLLEAFKTLEEFSAEKYGVALDGIGPAPPRFFEMFEQADFDICSRHLEEDEPILGIGAHLAARFLEEQQAA